MFILGKKLEMTRVFDGKGNSVPVTIIEAGPCFVTQVKIKDRDGYNAIQIGFGKTKNLSEQLKGHLKGLDNFRYLKEFRMDKTDNFKRGQKIDVSVFKEKDKVQAIGISKGKGYQGVVRRHHFKGGPASHGHRHVLRAPGSVGCMFPQHVRKGRRMAGRMGNQRTTIKNLEVLKVDKRNNLLVINGGVPGARNSLVMVEGLK